MEDSMIVVTGGSGYLGSHIVKRLVGLNNPVRVLIHNLERTKREKRLKGLDVEWFEGDVTRPDSLMKAFLGASAVIHTVAIAIEKGSGTYEEINYEGTINVVEAMKEAAIGRLIHISQLGAEKDLPYRFLASKGKAEDYVVNSGLNWTLFRPSVIWGPEDEFANTFARLVPFSPIIYPLVDKNALFEPVWVEDVTTSVLFALESQGTIGKKYEIGGPEILTLEEIERRILEAVGARRILVPFPKRLLKIVVTLMENLLASPPVTNSLLELLAVNNVTDENAIYEFVDAPRAFKVKHISPYMKEFNIGETINQFFGK
jgi:NADH dehydrogenase